MKLPHLFTNEKEAHFVLALLCVANSLLIIILFFFIFPSSKTLLPKIVPVSAQTPIVDFNLISPRANSTVSGSVPLVTTLTNGPKIVSADLKVDGQKVQALTSQKTEKLTIFWDSTKHQDGAHTLDIKVGQDNLGSSYISTKLNVQNNVSR